MLDHNEPLSIFLDFPQFTASGFESVSDQKSPTALWLRRAPPMLTFYRPLRYGSELLEATYCQYANRSGSPVLCDEKRFGKKLAILKD